MYINFSYYQSVKQEKEKTRLELQYERQARIAAEIQARKLEALSREEGAKVHELEEAKLKLENLLQEEKQALKDEEIGDIYSIFLNFFFLFLFLYILFLFFFVLTKCCYFETVRNLQARVLREEWERREQLEKLQQEQQDLLEMEKMKRLEFERKQQENEHQLRGIVNFYFYT